MRFWFRRRAAALLCLAACGWALLLVTAPLLATGRPPAVNGLRLSAFTYLVGGLVCHQRTERSFHLAGAQLPVCARCTGLYFAGAGGLLLGVMFAAAPRSRRAGAKRRFPAPFPQWSSWQALLTLAMAPMLASIGLEWLGLWGGSNLSRAVTAVPAGWTVGAMVAESLSFGVKL